MTARESKAAEQNGSLRWIARRLLERVGKQTPPLEMMQIDLMGWQRRRLKSRPTAKIRQLLLKLLLFPRHEAKRHRHKQSVR
jgi:hypothetical protein